MWGVRDSMGPVATDVALSFSFILFSSSPVCPASDFVPTMGSALPCILHIFCTLSPFCPISFSSLSHLLLLSPFFFFFFFFSFVIFP